MAIIKTKLRNRMHVETLDALMEISMNGPKLSDHGAVRDLIQAAYKVFVSRETFNPRQARFNNKNAKKKVKTAPPVQHHCRQNEDQAADNSNASLDDMADAEDTAAAEGSDAAAGEDSDATTVGGNNPAIDPYADVPRFQTPAEYQPVDKPMMIGPAFLKKHVIAHKFLTKWYVGKFTTKCYDKNSENFHKYAVHYPHDQKEYYHDLKLTDYGRDRFWLLMKKRKSK